MCKAMNARQVGKRRTADRVYVGRPSKWGNPFVIGRDGSRNDVIAKYRAWICGSRRSWQRYTSCAARTWCAGAYPSAATRRCSLSWRTGESRIIADGCKAGRSHSPAFSAGA
jgi:Domain of unknown function (DUF4326)